MRIYLSNYWIKSCIFSISVAFIIIVSTVIFCVWSHDEEDYILIIGSLFFVFLLGYLINISLKLVRYVIVENRQLVMYSFRKKKISSLNLDADIYYEILSLNEGTYSGQDFIIFSNLPFESFQKRGAFGLAKICKTIDTNENQVIMPFREQYISNLFNFSLCHKIY